MTLDQGKPLAEATLEVTSCSEHLDWHAEECRRIYGRVIPPRNPERAPDRGARAGGRVRRLHALELPSTTRPSARSRPPWARAARIVLKGPEDSPSAVMAIARMFHEAELCPRAA